MGGGIADTDGALYLGEVVHKRARPKRHSLRYRVFSMVVDCDQLAALDRRLRWFSVDRFSLFSLHQRDFGPRDGSSLGVFARNRARLAGLGDRVARVRLLCYPRLLGYAFNPLATWYLDDAGGRTLMLIYEVRNTFGERHCYEAVVENHGMAPISHELAKAFYVSPFNTVDGTYRFAIRPPAETVFTGIILSDAEGGLVTAYFEGQRRALTDAALLKVAIGFPLMTFKVIAGIHWEALRLWLKGVPLTLGLRPKASTPLPVERRI